MNRARKFRIVPGTFLYLRRRRGFWLMLILYQVKEVITMQESWLPTLITETPEQGFELALLLSRKAGSPAMLFVSDLINKKMIDFIKKGPPL